MEGVPRNPQIEAELARLKPEEAGDRIGSYKLREKLGEGGYGVVWVADQETPVRRRVALKIIKLGMDTKEVSARFEQERQALAMMDHPHIAKVFDAGATQWGRPYFVMELVRGIKITDYCDQANLSTADRLQVFITVCQAVQHAHQKGIIHRDLKPSNILVTLHDGVPVPKIIDFGVAKATQQQRLTDLTVYTQFEQMIGTPLYMSPEQAEMSGLDIDTRSDIYSLGVLLYELLTGRTPFDPEELMRQGLDEMRRTIREQEPKKPSTFLSTMAFELRTAVAQHRRADSAKLIGQIRGDLDWIVMKALEKDRSRRYETANGLAMDIQRHLADEPVRARPPSRVYRFRRLVRRNKLAFFATAAVAAALIGGLSFSIWSFRRERRQHEVADAERDAADKHRAAAKASEIHARQLLYAADMNHAGQTLQLGNLGRARRLLDRHRPKPGKEDEDLRGWEWRYLWQQCLGDPFTFLTKGEGYAFSVSFSRDGRRLAVGFSDGRVELWDVPGRKRLRVLQGKTGKLARVAFSPVDDALAATGERNVVKLHDFEVGSERVLCTAPGFIRDLAFSRDGDQLAVITRDEEAWQVVNVRTAEIVAKFEPPASVPNIAPHLKNAPHLNNVRLSPDHQRLYVTSGAFVDPELRCLNVSDGRVLWQKSGRETSGRIINGFSAMDLSPDGRFLVTATGFNAAPIRVWNAETGEPVTVLEGHTGWVCHLAFSRDGRMLASAGGDQSIRRWETTTWTQAAEPLRGNGDEVHAVAVSPDGKWLASGSKDGMVMLWDTQAPRPARGRQDLPAYIKSVRPLPDSRTLLAVAENGELFLIDLVTLRETPLAIPSAGSRSFSPPNFLGVYDGLDRLQVYEFSATGARLLGEFPVGAAFKPPFAYSAETRLLAWSNGSSPLQLGSLNEPAKQIELGSDDKLTSPVIFGAGAKYLLATTEKGEARVWDIAGRRRLRVAENYLSPFHLVLTPGLGNATWNRGLYHWIGAATVPAIANRAPLVDEPPAGFLPRGMLTDRAFSPDCRTFALSTLLGTVALYDTLSRERLAILHGHLQAVWAIVFSPDGSRLVSIGNNAEAVKLWDVATGQELLTLPGIGALLREATFTDDGSTLLLGADGQPGLCQFWRAPTWKEIEEVERAGSAWPHTEE
jgi:WD40 repeat protein/serine/threonine protein kinase